jgi:hypothetical protein
LQQKFVALCPRVRSQFLKPFSIGREGECHRCRQFGQRVDGAGFADAQSADNDGDAWRFLAVG